MAEFIQGKLEIAYFDARLPRDEVVAQVAFDDRGMTLALETEKGEPERWHGERLGQGHYRMSGPVTGMDASLHRFADSTILEGFWRNGRDRGFWRLHLPLDTVIPIQRALKKKLSGASQKPPANAPRKRRVRVAA